MFTAEGERTRAILKNQELFWMNYFKQWWLNMIKNILFTVKYAFFICEKGTRITFIKFFRKLLNCFMRKRILLLICLNNWVSLEFANKWIYIYNTFLHKNVERKIEPPKSWVPLGSLGLKLHYDIPSHVIGLVEKIFIGIVFKLKMKFWLKNNFY